MEEKICVFFGGILLGFLITAVIYALFTKNVRYFNTNRFKRGYKNEIIPIEFSVIKIEDDFTQYEDERIRKSLWKYTVETCFFLKKDKNFINEKYVFWDEPEKYKVGDILTLSNIKQ